MWNSKKALSQSAHVLAVLCLSDPGLIIDQQRSGLSVQEYVRTNRDFVASYVVKGGERAVLK